MQPVRKQIITDKTLVNYFIVLIKIIEMKLAKTYVCLMTIVTD